MVRNLVLIGLLAGPAICCVPAAAQAQEVDYAQRFRVFTARGEPAALADVVRALQGADVVLVGETHTDPVGHWIEAELVRGALASGRLDQSGKARPFALSLEMFERDVQGIVDEYLQGLITEDQFKQSARAWDHYASDYRPMLEQAKEAGVPVIAANAPRRYVNRVTRLGRNSLDELSDRARGFLPPLPYPEPSEAYRREWLALMAEMPMQAQCDPPVGAAPADSQPAAMPHRPAAPNHMASFMENGLQAQSLWDASMAHAITTFLGDNPGALVLHAVGGFHVENFTGIPEQLRAYRPQTRTLVVSMEPAQDFGTFDPARHSGQGDFVILTDKSLDLYYERNCAGKDTGR